MISEETKKLVIENLPKISIGVAVLIVVIIAAGLMAQRKTEENMESLNALHLVQKSALKQAEAKKYDEAIGELEKFRKEHSGGAAEYFALMILVKVATEADKKEEAVQYLQQAERLAPSDLLKILTLYNQGRFLEEKDQSEPALMAYQTALQNKKSAFLAPELLFAQATLLKEGNKLEEAKTVLNRIKEEHSQMNYYVRMADLLLNRIASKQAAK